MMIDKNQKNPSENGESGQDLSQKSVRVLLDPLALGGSFLSMNPELQGCIIVNEGDASHRSVTIRDEDVADYWLANPSFFSQSPVAPEQTNLFEEESQRLM